MLTTKGENMINDLFETYEILGAKLAGAWFLPPVLEDELPQGLIPDEL